MRDALAAALGAPVTGLRRAAGGDLAEAFVATLGDGRRVFVKTHPDGGFRQEAAGLRWLAEPAGAPRTPQVLAALDDPPLLALELVGPGGPADEEALGRGLAALHRAGAPAHGHVPGPDPRAPLRLGPLALPSDPQPDAAAHLAANRLLPLARRAHDRGALPGGAAAAVERVAARLPDLLGPDEPPARLHGDLWSGNVLAGPGGAPVLIDPAAHGGHRETDLAMLRLFGGPGDRCSAAYAEAHPLADGHEQRVALHQLVPLLVHAVLFGGGYGARAARAAARYA